MLFGEIRHDLSRLEGGKRRRGAQDLLVSAAAANDHLGAGHDPFIDPDGEVGRQAERRDPADLHAAGTVDRFLGACKRCLSGAEARSDHPVDVEARVGQHETCLLYTSPSPRD